MLTKEELKIAKQRYKWHIGNCRGRIDAAGNAIEMRLTFEEWLDIWLTSEHWHERGTKRGQYVMSRFNDIGHYEIGNVFIQLHSDNTRDDKKSEKWQEKNRLKNQKMHNDPVYQEKHRSAMQNLHSNVDFKAKNKAAIQKANSKQISCDSIVYPSIIEAAYTLAPATRLTSESKYKWLSQQMKKYPERYFYV